MDGIYERDNHEPEQGREQPGSKVGRADKGKHARGHVVEEWPVVTGVVLPCPRSQELIAEPGMDRFIMVQQLEVELPEAEDKCKDKNKEKNTFKSKD
jgi:hypothetical protein